MTNEIVKKAFAEATKDQQQQEISKIKQIVQSHLEKIEDLSSRKKKLDEELRVHKEILDDLKAGRLDKIEEYIEKDEKAKQYTLIIVKRVEKEYIPMQPWQSPYIVEWVQPQPFWPTVTVASGATNSGNAITTGASSVMYLCSTGNTVSNFASGTYTVTTGANGVSNSVTL